MTATGAALSRTEARWAIAQTSIPEMHAVLAYAEAFGMLAAGVGVRMGEPVRLVQRVVEETVAGAKRCFPLLPPGTRLPGTEDARFARVLGRFGPGIRYHRAMAEDLAPAWKPTYPTIRRIDHLWHLGERMLCGGIFLVMALMVFAAVVTETFGNRREWSDVAILGVLSLMAVRTRAVKEGETKWSWGVSVAVAAGATVLIAVGVYLYTERFAGGFIWAQKLALVMMIWVALLGASMATYERSHLSLELGEKIWPARILHGVKALALGIASAFCAAAMLLSVELVQAQRHEGLRVDANDWLPTWAAFVIVPYAFAAMSIRLLAQGYTTATRTSEPVEDRLPS